jgi:hypothetical protein
LILQLNHVGTRGAQAAEKQNRQYKMFRQRHCQTIMQQRTFDKRVGAEDL